VGTLPVMSERNSGERVSRMDTMSLAQLTYLATAFLKSSCNSRCRSCSCVRRRFSRVAWVVFVWSTNFGLPSTTLH